MNDSKSIESKSPLSRNAEFLAMIGHDVRQPIAELMKFLQMLPGMNLTSEQWEWWRNAMCCGEEAMLILNGILDGVQADTAESTVRPEWVNLREFVNRLADAFKPQAERRELRFEWTFEEGLPEWWFFDPVLLRQIVWNLLSNALKFTDAGTVTLFLAGKPSESGILLVLGVRDTGCGLSSSLQAQYGRVYLSGGKEPSPKAGVGLWIVSRLARAMEGKSVIHSVEGIGTEVTLHFPWRHRASAILA